MISQCQTCKPVTITFSSREICTIKTTKTQSCHKWDRFMPIHVFLFIIKLHLCKNDRETHIK